MLALQKTMTRTGLSLTEVDEPEAPMPGEITIEVLATGICGSDVHIYEWTPGYEFIESSLPVTLGHEFVGRVLNNGAALKFSVGERVVVRPSVTCGRCSACVAQNPDACVKRNGIGMTRNGAFARYVNVPERNCIRVPDNLPDQIAALAEPFSIGAQALSMIGSCDGLRVLVMGPGTIGQTIAVLSRYQGAAQVVIVGKNDSIRLNCLRQMGFANVVDLDEHSWNERVVPLAGENGFDVVFEATGVPKTLGAALSVLRRNGILVVSGIHPEPFLLDVTQLVRNQHQVRGSFRPSEKIWPTILTLLAEISDQIAPMVSHVLPLQQALEGFDLARTKLATKVIITP